MFFTNDTKDEYAEYAAWLEAPIEHLLFLHVFSMVIYGTGLGIGLPTVAGVEIFLTSLFRNICFMFQ